MPHEFLKVMFGCVFSGLRISRRHSDESCLFVGAYSLFQSSDQSGAASAAKVIFERWQRGASFAAVHFRFGSFLPRQESELSVWTMVTIWG